MTNPPVRISPEHLQDKPACLTKAALFAALFQALRHCPQERRDSILRLLENRLDSEYDDLDQKLVLLLDAANMSAKDRIYGLWLLYLSFFVHRRSQSGMQMWIGADLFSEDQSECLRMRGPGALLPDPMDLERELTILAQTVDDAASVKVSRVSPDQLSAIAQMP